MKKYRFKTKEEFLDEFGHDWRSHANFNNLGQMDYLLGTLIDSKYNYNMEKGFDFYIPNKGSSKSNFSEWCIGEKMYKLAEPTFTNGVMVVKNGLLG